MDKAIALFC